jgi:hypothetical protein
LSSPLQSGLGSALAVRQLFAEALNVDRPTVLHLLAFNKISVIRCGKDKGPKRKEGSFLLRLSYLAQAGELLRRER